MWLQALRFAKLALWAGLFCGATSGGVVAAAYYSTLEELPDVAELKHVSFETPMKIFTQDGKLIGEFGEHKRIPVSLEQIPLKMQQAFLAIEDTRFYEHTGVDPIGILRAAVVAATSGRAAQGASTITQQVARNFFLSRDKTIERKIKEVFIAWRMEQVLTKDEILELYLNKIALGHRSYGVVAAAQTYYGKRLDELTLAEIATIAGLPKAPSTLNPITNPQRAKERRHLVLQRMLTLGYITPEEFKAADEAPAKTYFHSTPLEAYAPYVAEEVRQAVLAKYGPGAYTRGFKIYTTVDSSYQTFAHQALFENLTAYDVRHGYRGPLFNLYDSTRGIRGSAKVPTEKNGVGANANNGIIMAARADLIAQLEAQHQKVDYQQVVAQVDAQDLLANNQQAQEALHLSYEAILERIRKEDKYESVTPALVLNVDDVNKEATIMTAQGEQKLLTWEGMSWARAFKSDRNQGEMPKLPSEFLIKGDLIFTYDQEVTREPKKGRNSEGTELAETYTLTTLTQLPEVEGALIALDPHSGAVRAMCGGYDFEKSKFNRATQLLRQTGSNFKPFIYSSAIAYGMALNSVIPDVPIKTWDVGSQTWWEPTNSPNRFDGPMTLREGLARSKNSISIRTIRHVGVENAVEHLRKFDIYIPKFQQSESMALGSVELTPLQVATAYSAFANGGYKLTPYLIDRIELDDGTLLYQAHPRVADPAAPDNVINDIELRYTSAFTPSPVDLARQSHINDSKVEHPLMDEIFPHGIPGYNAKMVDLEATLGDDFYADEATGEENSSADSQLRITAQSATAEGTSGMEEQEFFVTGPQLSLAMLADLDSLAQPTYPAPQILSHGHAYLMASLMQSNIYGGYRLDGERYWGTGYRSSVITGRKDLHGKTGTTNNVHDAWFSGFNNNLVVTSWVGFDNDRDLGYARGMGSESGSATALPIFANFFRDAQNGVEEADIPRPAGLVSTRNRGITEPALPGMFVVDEAAASRSVKNTGIDSSTVEAGDIF